MGRRFGGKQSRLFFGSSPLSVEFDLGVEPRKGLHDGSRQGMDGTQILNLGLDLEAPRVLKEQYLGTSVAPLRKVMNNHRRISMDYDGELDAGPSIPRAG